MIYGTNNNEKLQELMRRQNPDNNPVFLIWYTTKKNKVTDFQNAPCERKYHLEKIKELESMPNFNWFVASDEGKDFCERNNKALMASLFQGIYGVEK